MSVLGCMNALRDTHMIVKSLRMMGYYAKKNTEKLLPFLSSFLVFSPILNLNSDICATAPLHLTSLYSLHTHSPTPDTHTHTVTVLASSGDKPIPNSQRVTPQQANS